MRRKIYIIICMMLLIIANATTIEKIYSGNNELSRTDAVKIANETARQFGYDIEAMNMEVHRYDKLSNFCMPDKPIQEFFYDLHKRLTNKEYWLVYYEHRPKDADAIIVGGDLCIFIDIDNGEVIGHIRGE